MMLLGFHVISIGLLIAVVGSVAFRMGQQSGFELAKEHLQEQAKETENQSSR